jgi:hypothetical protein
MNFKSILVVGLSIATLGLALPAHAGEEAGGGVGGATGTVIDNQQGAVVTGDGNHTNQTIKNKVHNRQKGSGTGGDTGTSLTNGQSADVYGNGNRTNQEIKNKVKNSQRLHN